MIIHFGVWDIPYPAHQPMSAAEIWERIKKGKPPSRAAVRGSPTTGDVAEILEDHYGVMRAFYEAHQQDVAQLLVEAVAGHIENLKLGAPTDTSPFAAAESAIQEKFKEFIESGADERQAIPGTPTAAALRGVNHRLKHPYAKSNPRRPSFIDTGMYVDSIAVSVE